MKNLLKIIMFILGLMFIFTCDLPHEPGPMPNDIIETEFIQGLNVLGVIRADDVTGTSFLQLNRAVTTEEIYSDTISDFSPDVDHVKIIQQSTNTSYAMVRGNDSIPFWDEITFRDTSFLARSGETYHLEVQAPGYPTLTGSTAVPTKPQMVSGSLARTDDHVEFELSADPSAYEYKLYLIFADDVLEKVIKPAGQDAYPVSWDISKHSGTPLFLMLCALDENLTRYGNAPFSFMPNTYHPDVSTVDGGYGCFGSLSVTTIQF